jgi:protocatechuate 3,4-dioxygenase beta subunit
VYRETKSDADGGFSFARVGPWRVHVVADRDPGGVVSSAEIHAAEGQSTSVTLVLSPAAAVRGTVVDGDGQPVSGAVLSVEGVPWTVPGATSDDSGAFRLALVPREAGSLVAAARGYRSARVALGAREADAELVVRVQLGAAASVEGVVRDADGAPVRAQVVACEGQPIEARIESSEDGSFELPPSTIGCDAVAEHADFAPSDAARVVEGRRLALRLMPGGAIEGDVVDERGAGVTPLTVGIESFTPARGRRLGSAEPRSFEDGRGAFRWDKLTPGSYVLTASTPGRPPARSASVEVTGGAATRGVRILLARGGTVTGHVYDERHAPISGVELRFDVVSSVLDSSAVAKTDETGEYRLEGAPAGLFTVRAEKDAFRVRLVSGLRVESGAVTRQEITLAALDGGPQLELGGIGAALEQRPEGIVMHDVFAGDPAERAGLRAGDRILSIDGEPTDGMSLADALQRLRGGETTTVGVSVQRPGTGETLDVVLVRATIVH